jgi:hypothetical protein
MMKLSLDEIEMWLAHGIMLAAALQRTDYQYDHWYTVRGGPRSERRWMREWCVRTMNSLDEARRRKLRVAMMIPTIQGEKNGENQDGS